MRAVKVGFRVSSRWTRESRRHIYLRRSKTSTNSLSWPLYATRHSSRKRSRKRDRPLASRAPESRRTSHSKARVDSLDEESRKRPQVSKNRTRGALSLSRTSNLESLSRETCDAEAFHRTLLRVGAPSGREGRARRSRWTQRTQRGLGLWTRAPHRQSAHLPRASRGAPGEYGESRRIEKKTSCAAFSEMWPEVSSKHSVHLEEL